jgi:hypothetical protein
MLFWSLLWPGETLYKQEFYISESGAKGVTQIRVNSNMIDKQVGIEKWTNLLRLLSL